MFRVRILTIFESAFYQIFESTFYQFFSRRFASPVRVFPHAIIVQLEKALSESIWMNNDFDIEPYSSSVLIVIEFTNFAILANTRKWTRQDFLLINIHG